MVKCGVNGGTIFCGIKLGDDGILLGTSVNDGEALVGSEVAIVVVACKVAEWHLVGLFW